MSDSQRLHDRPCLLNVSSVQRPRRLEQQHVDLFLGNGAVLHAPWYDHELPLLQPDVAVTILHAELPANDQKQLILLIVLVPDKLALELHEVDVLPVQLADDPRVPMIVEEAR